MSNYPFTLNGVTYQESDFTGMGYVTALPSALADLIRELRLFATATSVTSVTVGVGAKSFTIQSGRAFRAGDQIYISSTVTPATRMMGTVTSYDFGTGALVVDVDAVSGAGTLASWNIGRGGVADAFVNDNMLTLDNGGIGYRSSAFTQGGVMLGLGEPSCLMDEIWEDFAGSQGQLATLDNTTTFNPPWVSKGMSSYSVYVDANTDTTSGAGSVLLQSGTSSLASAIIYYGNQGFLHCGRGGIVYESNIFNAYNGGDYNLKLGLASQVYALTRNIFSSGGIGFEASQEVNNGRYVLTAGSYGSSKKINTSFIPSSGVDSFRIEIDHDGLNAEFYINKAFAGRISNILPSSDPGTLMQPAFESGVIWGGNNLYVQTKYYIDSLYVRKHLLR